MSRSTTDRAPARVTAPGAAGRLPTMRRSPLTRALLTGALALVAVAWYLAVMPPEVPTLKVLSLSGPGGVLGLAAGWAAFAAHRERFGWRTGLASALVGVLVLPPIVGAVLMLTATLFPAAILTLFIAGAWLALGIGGAIAAVDALHGRLTRARADGRGVRP